MPAKSQAQREFLNARFGHAWVKAHHFDNPGKLPAKVKRFARGGIVTSSFSKAHAKRNTVKGK